MPLNFDRPHSEEWGSSTESTEFVAQLGSTELGSPEPRVEIPSPPPAPLHHTRSPPGSLHPRVNTPSPPPAPLHATRSPPVLSPRPLSKRPKPSNSVAETKRAPEAKLDAQSDRITQIFQECKRSLDAAKAEASKTRRTIPWETTEEPPRSEASKTRRTIPWKTTEKPPQPEASKTHPTPSTSSTRKARTESTREQTSSLPAAAATASSDTSHQHPPATSQPPKKPIFCFRCKGKIKKTSQECVRCHLHYHRHCQQPTFPTWDDWTCLRCLDIEAGLPTYAWRLSKEERETLLESFPFCEEDPPCEDERVEGR